MGFRTLLGFLLIIVAVIILLALVVFPIIPGAAENPFVLQYLAAVACEPNEQANVEVIVTTDSDGTGYTPDLTCVGREGERRDGSPRLFLIAGVGFVVPLLLGIFIINFSLRGLKSDAQDFIDTAHVVADIFREGMTQESQQGTSTLDAGLSPGFKAGISGSGTANFVTKLKELEEARSAGLITQVEYDRLRADILKQLGDR